MVTATKAQTTYEDYLKLPDDLQQELVEGELQMVAAPIPRHQRISREIAFALLQYVKAKKLGEVFYAPCDVVLGEHNVFQPDILFIARERLAIIQEKNIQGAPDLVMEILSESTAHKDLVSKRYVYAQFGVKEYWVVDPIAKIVVIWTLQGNKLVLYQEFGGEETLVSPWLSGFSLNLPEIFEPAQF